MVLKFLFYKPVVDYGLGRIGFGKMFRQMTVRFVVTFGICFAIMGAVVWNDNKNVPNPTANLSSEQYHAKEMSDRAAREAKWAAYRAKQNQQ